VEHNVYILGAGFSVGLGYPLLNNLLEYIWDDISQNDRDLIARIIKFHNPNFEPNHPFTFPDIETLLTQFDANIELFEYTRNTEGSFERDQLIQAKNTLLIEMAKKFHETNETVTLKKFNWLRLFKDKLESETSTIISFNYDLVLEKILFEKPLRPENYGFDAKKSPLTILKPHGSLNWFQQNDKTGKLKQKKIQRLLDDDDVAMFNLLRHPVSSYGHTYIPHLIPPTFTKTFEGEVYKATFRNSVAALSKATNVFFLGCSLPKSDFHSQFMIRCGLHNQIDGEILDDYERSVPVGAAKIYIINPDEVAAMNTSHLISNEHKFIWKKMTVANWITEELAS